MSTDDRPNNEAPPSNDHKDRLRFTTKRRRHANPFARRMAALRVALIEQVSKADMRAMARKLLELAKGGDLAAIRLLLRHTVGQPTPATDPDMLKVDELAKSAALTCMSKGIENRLAESNPQVCEKVSRGLIDLLQPGLGQTLTEDEPLAPPVTSPEEWVLPIPHVEDAVH